jgi:dinuclear metal center YbgI/SA1388 family protein
MASRDRIVSALDSYLAADRFEDYAPVGLQVEGNPKVRKILLGVSACMELFEEALSFGAQMVVVHHGMFWKKESRVLKGPLKGRVRFLLNNDLSLLSYHLPLDCHPVVGNNARIVRLLGAARKKPFGIYGGIAIGFAATFQRPVTVDSVAKKLSSLAPESPLVLKGGSRKVKRFGVVSGGAGEIFPQALEAGLDLFITGEPYEPAQALCRETGIHFIALGHHNSEKTGVMALAAWLKRRFKIPARFKDIPNPA